LATGGHFFRTTNSGLNWQHFLIDKYANLSTGDITFIDDNTGWYVGTFGVIFKTTNGGTVFLNKLVESLPKNYSLFQNYPNPFNSVTKIKYTLAKNSSVKLEVFDILGRKVKVLVSGQQNAGIYEVTFFADELSSGIYFYRLEVDDKHIQTRRMILLK